MHKKDYELIEHTADIGIKVEASDLAGLFTKAAYAMFDIIAEKKSLLFPSLSKEGLWADLQIKLKADNLEELFIDWLNELLSLSATKELMFYDFQINKLDENNLEAVAIGENVKNYRVNVEIKAATYHELEIRRINSHWQAKVIFDV